MFFLCNKELEKVSSEQEGIIQLTDVPLEIWHKVRGVGLESFCECDRYRVTYNL